MRRSTDFSTVMRVGLRARTGRVVVHHALSLDGTSLDGTSLHGPSSRPPLVGFVVSKAVGNSVERHTVTRRLRAQLATRLDALALGSGTVVRALPGASAAGSAELGRDLDHALSRISKGARP
ncbi:ribonuclease P protein component [uncultured Jatrophihabitans sp.]|uniref:ribonuclease P protein component n=1 Tax=uncultured Jatrophihabitans sp. TaxID=1610747 RepID=UPI0035C9B3BA